MSNPKQKDLTEYTPDEWRPFIGNSKWNARFKQQKIWLTPQTRY